MQAEQRRSWFSRTADTKDDPLARVNSVVDDQARAMEGPGGARLQRSSIGKENARKAKLSKNRSPRRKGLGFLGDSGNTTTVVKVDDLMKGAEASLKRAGEEMRLWDKQQKAAARKQSPRQSSSSGKNSPTGASRVLSSPLSMFRRAATLEDMPSKSKVEIDQKKRTMRTSASGQAWSLHRRSKSNTLKTRSLPNPISEESIKSKTPDISSRGLILKEDSGSDHGSDSDTGQRSMSASKSRRGLGVGALTPFSNSGIVLDDDDDDEYNFSDSSDEFNDSKLNILEDTAPMMDTFAMGSDLALIRDGKEVVKISNSGVSVGADNLQQVLTKEDLYEIEAVGRGQHGAVYKALHIPSLTLVAKKQMQALEQEARHQMLRELQAYSTLSSPQIVNFFGAYFEQGKIFIASEFMDYGGLDNFVKKYGKPGLPEHVLRHIAWQAIKGLQYLHSKRKVHRDIKPDNVLLNRRGEAKLGDFGLLTEQVVGDTNKLETFVGTMRYLSPERLNSGGGYGAPSDVWAMGLTLIFMATGSEVSNASDFWEVHGAFADQNSAPKLDRTKFSPELCDLVDKALKHDPFERWTAAQLLNHPFFQKSSDTNKPTTKSEATVEKEAAAATGAGGAAGQEMRLQIDKVPVQESGRTTLTPQAVLDVRFPSDHVHQLTPFTPMPKELQMSEAEVAKYFKVDRTKDIDVVVHYLLEQDLRTDKDGQLQVHLKLGTGSISWNIDDNLINNLAKTFDTDFKSIGAAFDRAIKSVILDSENSPGEPSASSSAPSVGRQESSPHDFADDDDVVVVPPPK